MLKHILISAIKNALQNGVLAFTKLFGISLSFAVILLAISYVFYETSFDKHFKDKDRIFRIYMKGFVKGRDLNIAVTEAPLARAVKATVPGIEDAVTVQPIGGRVFTTNFKDFIFSNNLISANTNFFSFFGIENLTASSDPLEAKNSIAISEKLAAKLFGSPDNALNRTVHIKNTDEFDDYAVTVVFKDLPSGSHLRCSAVINIANQPVYNDDWNSQNFNTFIKTVSSSVDQKSLDLKITRMVYTHSPFAELFKNVKKIEDFKYKKDLYVYYLTEKLTDIHFSKHKFDYAVTSNKTYVYGAVILALLVLLISSFNYINLSAADFKVRSKEFGIRKTIGASTKNVIIHYISESLLFWLTGFIAAVILFRFLHGTIDNFLGFDTQLTSSESFKIALLCFVGLILFNLFMNVIPVSIFSKRNVSVLSKGEINPGKRQGLKGFLLVQFFISVVVILCTLFVYKQIRYANTRNPGYNYENVLYLDNGGVSSEKIKLLMDRIRNIPDVENVATCSRFFGGSDPGMNGFYFETETEDNYFHASHMEVTEEFFKTLNIQLSQGRFFEEDRTEDRMAVVLNETAAREYLKNESLLEKNIIYPDRNSAQYKVIGILKDFNFRSIHNPIEPLVIFNGSPQSFMYLKINNNSEETVIKEIQSAFKDLSIPGTPNYSYLKNILAENYSKDEKAMKLLLFISVISILISCFGLYAIAYFTISGKIKEIGIRKVNGAKIPEILALLNKGFLVWIIIAFILSCPFAWYAMNKWLENFAYKTELSWWVFAVAGLLTTGIALLTVSWQSYIAARRNPVESLRYE